MSLLRPANSIRFHLLSTANCYEYWISYETGKVLNTVTWVLNPQTCQTHCRNTPGCAVWTLNINWWDCVLRDSSFGTRMPAPFMVSGHAEGCGM